MAARPPTLRRMKVYAVGGAVRDRLLGLPVTDHDWVVVGATAEQMLLRPFQSRRRGEMVGSPATADAPSFIAAA